MVRSAQPAVGVWPQEHAEGGAVARSNSSSVSSLWMPIGQAVAIISSIVLGTVVVTQRITILETTQTGTDSKVEAIRSGQDRLALRVEELTIQVNVLEERLRGRP